MAAEDVVQAQREAEQAVLQHSSDEELARGAEKLIGALNARALASGDLGTQAWLNVANDSMAKARMSAAAHKAAKTVEQAIPEPLADGFQPTPGPGAVSGVTHPAAPISAEMPPPFGGPRHGGI